MLGKGREYQGGEGTVLWENGKENIAPPED